MSSRGGGGGRKGLRLGLCVASGTQGKRCPQQTGKLGLPRGLPHPCTWRALGLGPWGSGLAFPRAAARLEGRPPRQEVPLPPTPSWPQDLQPDGPGHVLNIRGV